MSPSADTTALFLETVGLGHVHDIRRLDAQVHNTTWSTELWRRELGRPVDQACYVAASIGGRHVGHAGLLVQAGDGHVVTVAVDPAHQRRGIASQLVLVLARWAVRSGLEAMTLEVRYRNTAAQELYRRFGFGPAGLRPGYYADDGEDALIMWAHGVSEQAYLDRLDALADTVSDRGVDHHPALRRLIDGAGSEVSA